MIEENYVQAAIKIRREFLKLTNNMQLYKRKAKNILDNLEDIIGQIERISTESNENTDRKEIVEKLEGVLKEVEKEGKMVNELIDPLNNEIEKLALEEQELWRNIKNKYPNLGDDEIVEYIKNRLIQANLS
jgi:predicted  nucleic acid-binding Zn-ribbon protein